MRSKMVPEDLVETVRQICLDLPEAAEVETWGHPTFRVRNKIFVGCGTDNDVTTMSAKTVDDVQGGLLAEGDPFFYPKYVGSKGWIGITLSATTDWDRIEEIVVDSYRAIAPKKLGKLLDADD